MSEPTLICSAPELASSAQKVALYSHYAATVAGFLGGGLMLMRSREQEKLPHFLAAAAAFGVGLAAFYSQWEFNQFLYEHRETVSNAVAIRAGLWAIWATLIVVGLSLLPGFRFKQLKKLALIPLIAFAVLSFGFGSLAEAFASKAATLKPSTEMIDSAGGLDAYTALAKSDAFNSALAFGLPAVVCALLLAGTYIFTQAKKAERRSEENHQSRTGVMTLIAVAVPALAYSAGTFLVAGGGQRVDQAVLLFNVADVISMFFLMCALDQQQAYAQAYAQQLYAQQQAYAQYYAQQQAAAANAQAQQPAAPAGAVPANAVPAAQPPQDPAAAMAAYQQQQAQYYAQQQAYAAYQQQQQAYQQAYAAQQQYAQPQQQVYAQAYAQQQAAYHRQQATPAAAPAGTPHGVRKVAPAAHPATATPGAVKKIGGVRQIKKIR